MTFVDAPAESSTRSILRIAALALALVALVLWGRSVADRTDPSLPQINLASGESSREALVERFVEALTANDRQAVESLRIDENEYRKLIVPGSVQPGQPPQIMPDKKSEYFWKRNNTLNIYTLDNLLPGLGGKKLKVEKIDIQRVERLAGYTVHRDPIIHLKNEDGVVTELQVGSIAEYGDRFKFISYHSD